MTADNEGGYACVVAGDKWEISVSNFLLILLNLPCSAVRIKGRERKKDIETDRHQEEKKVKYVASKFVRKN